MTTRKLTKLLVLVAGFLCFVSARAQTDTGAQKPPISAIQMAKLIALVKGDKGCTIKLKTGIVTAFGLGDGTKDQLVRAFAALDDNNVDLYTVSISDRGYLFSHALRDAKGKANVVQVILVDQNLSVIAGLKNEHLVDNKDNFDRSTLEDAQAYPRVILPIFAQIADAYTTNPKGN
jgi:hypothetical protein